MKLYDELVWRGLIENITDESLIEKINNGGLTFYIGSLVNLEEKEIYEACLKKIEKQEKRLEEGY